MLILALLLTIVSNFVTFNMLIYPLLFFFFCEENRAYYVAWSSNGLINGLTAKYGRGGVSYLVVTCGYYFLLSETWLLVFWNAVVKLFLVLLPLLLFLLIIKWCEYIFFCFKKLQKREHIWGYKNYVNEGKFDL